MTRERCIEICTMRQWRNNKYRRRKQYWRM